MKKPAIRTFVQLACVFAVLAAIAVPLSGLMVSQSTADIESSTSMSVTDHPQVQATDSSSAVSAMMAGSAVGRRGGNLNARTATTWVP